jgi:predicted nucleic acid-binding protein
MDVVVDTSVLIAVIANEPERQALIRLTAGATLFAPASVHWEIGNACSAMLKRRRIAMPQAEKVIEAYHQIPVHYVDVDLVDAVRLADRFGLYAYDGYVLSCALTLRYPLLSLDRKLVEAARQAEAKLLEVSP